MPGSFLGRTNPHGLMAVVLLSIDAVQAGDDAGICSAVVEMVSMLSAGGVSRILLHLAGQVGALTRPRNETPIPPRAIDEKLGQLVGSSLLTFSMDWRTVTAYRLVTRVIRGADGSPWAPRNYLQGCRRSA